MRSKHDLPICPLSAIFEFSPTGRVKRIFLNTHTDRDELILENSLRQLFKPSHFNLVRRLFHG